MLWEMCTHPNVPGMVGHSYAKWSVVGLRIFSQEKKDTSALASISQKETYRRKIDFEWPSR